MGDGGEFMEKDNKLFMQKYRNDLKWAKEHKFIPNIHLPNWMKPSKRLQKLISQEHFQDDVD